MYLLKFTGKNPEICKGLRSLWSGGSGGVLAYDRRFFLGGVRGVNFLTISGKACFCLILTKLTLI